MSHYAVVRHYQQRAECSSVRVGELPQGHHTVAAPPDRVMCQSKTWGPALCVWGCWNASVSNTSSQTTTHSTPFLLPGKQASEHGDVGLPTSDAERSADPAPGGNARATVAFSVDGARGDPDRPCSSSLPVPRFSTQLPLMQVGGTRGLHACNFCSVL